MADNAIGLNLITLKGDHSPPSVLKKLDAAKAAGFKGVGLWLAMVDEWKKAGRTLDAFKQELADRDLKADEFCFVTVLDEEGKVANRRRQFEVAAEVGAPQLICLYTDQKASAEKARNDWGEFVRSIEDTGVNATFEFVGAWEKYKSPLEAWEVIKEGPSCGTMVFDTFHFWRGGGDLSQLDEVPVKRISLVHLNDVKDVPREQATDKDRTYPGKGVMPLEEILGALLSRGYGGPLSVEIFGDVQEQEPVDVAELAMISARKVVNPL